MLLRTLGDLADALEVASAQFGRYTWWRGHSDSAFRLVAGAYRAPYCFDDYFESNAVQNFAQGAQARMSRHPGDRELAKWLFLMQHHRVPTRLLDWTESILVAAHFACLGPASVDGILWALEPFTLNQHTAGTRQLLNVGQEPVKSLIKAAFDPHPPDEVVRDLRPRACAMTSPHTNRRMFMQRSRFTIHGGPSPLEGFPDHERFLMKFVIPADSKTHLQKRLWLLGYRESFLFPDLDHLADDVKTTRPPYWLDDAPGLYAGFVVGVTGLGRGGFEVDTPMMDFDPRVGFRINLAAVKALGLPPIDRSAVPPNLGAVSFVQSPTTAQWFMRSSTPDDVATFILFLPDVTNHYELVGNTTSDSLPAIPRGRYRLAVDDQGVLAIEIESRLDWRGRMEPTSRVDANE